MDVSRSGSRSARTRGGDCLRALSHVEEREADVFELLVRFGEILPAVHDPVGGDDQAVDFLHVGLPLPITTLGRHVLLFEACPLRVERVHGAIGVVRLEGRLVIASAGI